MSDNTTTFYVINNMGRNKSDLYSQITFDIWSWAEKSNIWITEVYIPKVKDFRCRWRIS